MEQKAKFVIIGLTGALVVFIFLFFQSFSSKQALVREKNDLQRENDSLNAQKDKLGKQLSSQQAEFDSLKRRIEAISGENEELQNRYALVSKEKEAALKEVEDYKKQAMASPSAPAGQEAYWAQVLKTKADLEVQLNSLRQEFKAMRLNNEQLDKEKNNLELDLTTLKHDNDELKRKLDYNQQLMDNLAQEVVRERSNKIKLEETLKTIRAENAVLARQLKSQNTLKVNLERKLQAVQDKKDELEVKYANMEANLTVNASQLKSLKQQVEGAISQETVPAPAPQVPAAEPAPAAPVPDKGASSTVELPPIIVRPQANAAVQARSGSGAALPAGKVISLNKENNFVIIDIGEEASVKVGDALRVYGKDDKPAADIEVIQTRKDISACDIKREYAPFSVGDIVK